MRRRSVGWLSLSLSCCLLGCSTAPTPVDVSGQIVTERTGVVLGVEFWPQDGPGKRLIEAVCSADGSFALQCLPGTYKVKVLPRVVSGEDVPVQDNVVPPFPGIFMDATRTPLVVDVPESGIANVRLVVK